MKERENEFREESIPSIQDAIKDMHMSKLLFLTKKGRFFSYVVEDYLKDKQKFLPYIKETKRQEFMNIYRAFFEKGVGNLSDEMLRMHVEVFEDTGEVLKLLGKKTDWNQVEETIRNQAHIEATCNDLIKNVAYFSEYGLDFIEHFFGEEIRREAEDKIDFENYYFSCSFEIPYEKLAKYF
ncbi:MAG: hypothetical protein IJ867_03045 [Clostridia bacterium]|nr:hypothetical protein [Clostridia bacterium]